MTLDTHPQIWGKNVRLGDEALRESCTEDVCGFFLSKLNTLMPRHCVTTTYHSAFQKHRLVLPGDLDREGEKGAEGKGNGNLHLSKGKQRLAGHH